MSNKKPQIVSCEPVFLRDRFGEPFFLSRYSVEGSCVACGDCQGCLSFLGLHPEIKTLAIDLRDALLDKFSDTMKMLLRPIHRTRVTTMYPREAGFSGSMGALSLQVNPWRMGLGEFEAEGRMSWEPWRHVDLVFLRALVRLPFRPDFWPNVPARQARIEALTKAGGVCERLISAIAVAAHHKHGPAVRMVLRVAIGDAAWQTLQTVVAHSTAPAAATS